MPKKDSQFELPRNNFRFDGSFHKSNFLKMLEKNEKIERHPSYRYIKKTLAIFALTGVTLGLAAAGRDIQNNMDIANHAKIDITVAGKPLKAENSDNAIIFLDGFGTYNADSLIRYVGPAIQPVTDGEEWSVSYGNAPLSIDAMTNEVEALTEKRGIKNVVMVGYSTGGILAIEEADKLVNDTNLNVKAVIAISTPNGYDGLRPARQAELEAVKTVASIPYAEYSTPLRFGGEMYFRRSLYTTGNIYENISNFFITANNVESDLGNKNVPGTWLLVDQGFAIINADLKKNIADIGNAPSTKLLPDIEYLGTAEPGYDYMVNNWISSKNICNYAKKVRLSCQVDNVPDAIHTRPDLSKDEYKKTIQQASAKIQSALADNKALYSLDNLRILTPPLFKH
jgi:pimeloyl-ACP methyl ester carboxylesterase